MDFGPGRTGEQGAQRLVDFSSLGADPPIFIGANLHIDWDISNSEMPGQMTFGFAIRGRATIVATNDITLSDNILYRNGLNTTNLADADFLSVIAQRDVWYGDPEWGTLVEGSGIMLAGRDFNFVFFDQHGTPKTPKNGITLNGTMLNGQIAMFRDFANPDDAGGDCSDESTGCLPIRFDAGNTSVPTNDPTYFDPVAACGRSEGCWRFLKRDANGSVCASDENVPSGPCRDTNRKAFRQ